MAGDREAAKALADRDEVVDSLCHDIEELTLQQLTVAGITSPRQLRYLVTVIRMLPDLERNGDLAEHVARRAARGLGAELSARSRGLLERMGEVAVHMWRATTDAYAERRAAGWALVDDLDDEMDDLHVSLTVEVVAGTMPLPVAVELALLARFYERFGDHAVNLAKRVAVLAPHRRRAGYRRDRRLDPGRSASAASGDDAEAHQRLGDLDGVEGGALAEVVPAHEQRQHVGRAVGPRIRPTSVGSMPAARRRRRQIRQLDARAPRRATWWPRRARAAPANSATMAREWPVNTGTRTQVQATARSGMSRILRLSSRNFCSSLVSPEPSSTSDPAMDSTLWAMRSGNTRRRGRYGGPVEGQRGRPVDRRPAAARRARRRRPGPSRTPPGRSRPPGGSSPAASCSGLSTGMATMVVQLGLATIPFGIERSVDSLTSGTTRGTSGSMRQADELSTTIAPASANRGASSRDAVAPLEKRAMSMPDGSAVAASSTTSVGDPGRPACARPTAPRRTGGARPRGTRAPPGSPA